MSLHIFFFSLVDFESWTCPNTLLKPISRQRSSIILVFFWFILVRIDCPMIQWYEVTCSYLWNGMLIGRTWRLKHRRNGGKRSRRWGNIYAAWHPWPRPTPPPTSIKKKHVFVYTKFYLYKQWGLCPSQKWPKGMETAREEAGGGVVQGLLMFGYFGVNAMIPVLLCIHWKVALSLY